MSEVKQPSQDTIDAAKKKKEKVEDPFELKSGAHIAKTDEGRAELRFQEQCYLLSNFERITEISKARTGKSAYKHSTQLMNADPGYFISEIMAIKGIDPLFTAKPSDYSALVPKVLLYKIYPNSQPGQQSEVLLPFSTFSTFESLESIFQSGKGRGDDVVLKSISFDFRNNNIALAKRLVEVKITLLFSNAKALVIKRNDEFSYLDLFLRGGVGSRDTKPSERVFEADYYRIKAVVGWQIPPDVDKDLDKKFKNRIKRAKIAMFLELRNYDLNFQENGMLEVTLDYTSFIEAILDSSKMDIFAPSAARKKLEEGIVTKYEGLIERATQRAALARENLPEGEEASMIDAIKYGLVSDTTLLLAGPLATTAAAVLSEERRKMQEDLELKKRRTDELTSATEVLDVHKDFLEGFKAKTKMNRYQAILDKMIDKIYYMDVLWTDIVVFQELNKQVILGSRSHQAKLRTVGTSAARQRTFEADSAALAQGRKPVPPVILKHEPDAKAVSDPGGMVTYGKKVSSAMGLDDFGKFTDPEEERAKGPGTEQKKKLLAEALAATDANTPSANDTERLNFFFFGDLVDAVIGHGHTAVLGDVSLAASMAENKIRILLGPVIFYNYYTGNPTMINLADTPISLKLFLEFFHNRIVTQNREKYPLHAFLRDSVNSLLVPALGEKCFEGAGLNKCDLRFVTVPGRDHGTRDRVPTGRIQVEDIKSDGEVLSLRNDYTPVKNLYNYIIIYASSEKATSLRGDMKEDHRKGIYHMVLGADRGLLKSAKFKKMKMKHAPEMMAERSRNAAPMNNEATQLWYPYNADLTLIGNAIFRPGQKLYIDVSSTGLGRPGPVGSTSAARMLGLGGYYLVVASNNVIDQDGWKTDITCIFDSPGDGMAPTTATTDEEFVTEPAYLSDEEVMEALGLGTIDAEIN